MTVSCATGGCSRVEERGATREISRCTLAGSGFAGKLGELAFPETCDRIA